MTVTSKRITAAVAVTLISILAGCGSDTEANPESDIRSTVDTFTVLVSENDPACLDHLAPTGKYIEYHKQLVKLLDDSDFCLGSRHKDWASLTISKVTVIDDSATVAFEGQNETLKLDKTDGSWLISDGGF
ncbi:MAG TPA: hypothetical protein VFD37_01180 [Solirubrobacterales bacterium]|nr:hypothetical protein [Solirubrobacterales bacterium]